MRELFLLKYIKIRCRFGYTRKDLRGVAKLKGEK